MAATTQDRNTPAKLIERQIVLDLSSGQDIPAGAIVCSNAAGEAVNGSDSAGLIMEGRAQHRATYANGDRKITVARGVFCWGNDGTIAKANIGQLATIVDNQTVSLAATTANDIGGGYIEELAPEGVFISVLGGKVAAA